MQVQARQPAVTRSHLATMRPQQHRNNNTTTARSSKPSEDGRHRLSQGPKHGHVHKKSPENANDRVVHAACGAARMGNLASSPIHNSPK